MRRIKSWFAASRAALLDGPDPGLSTSRYAKLAQCSFDPARRDSKLLVESGMLAAGDCGGRSITYQLHSPLRT